MNVRDMILPRYDTWATPYYIPENQATGRYSELVTAAPLTNAGMLTIIDRNFANPSQNWWFKKEANPWTNTSSGDWLADLSPFGTVEPLRVTRPFKARARHSSFTLRQSTRNGGIDNPASPIPVQPFGWIAAVAGSVIQAGGQIGAAALAPKTKIVAAPVQPAPAPVPQPSTLEKSLPIMAIGGVGLLMAIMLIKK